MLRGAESVVLKLQTLFHSFNVQDESFKGTKPKSVHAACILCEGVGLNVTDRSDAVTFMCELCLLSRLPHHVDPKRVVSA